jgi:hypothetical protein
MPGVSAARPSRHGLDDHARGAIGVHRRGRRRAQRGKPAELVLVAAADLRVDVRAGAHQSRRDRRDGDTVFHEIGAQRF